MTVDALPVLAFKVAESQFDIASGQSFISLRDQAVRVRTMLSAMHEAKLFDRVVDEEGNGDEMRGRKVLIVGAGYAGVSTALWLAERSIHATLVDAEARPFSVQLGCSTRHLSLTQYDWPGLHHDSHDYPDGLTPDFIAYPWVGRTVTLPPPIRLKGAPPRPTSSTVTITLRPHDHLATKGILPASALAKDWETQFLGKLSGPHLTWRKKTRFRPGSVAPGRGGVGVELEDVTTGAITSHWFDYIFYAAGFGSDGDVVKEDGGGARRTPGFWSDDTLASVGTLPPPRILISGGGDGALQDFIRVLVEPTLTTASEVLARIIELMMKRHARDHRQSGRKGGVQSPRRGHFRHGRELPQETELV